MKLDSSQINEIESLMELAKIQKRLSEPVEIKLYTGTKDAEIVKTCLRENYKVKEITDFPRFDRGNKRTLYAKVPIRYVRKVLEEPLVNDYGWPAELETLSRTPLPLHHSH